MQHSPRRQQFNSRELGSDTRNNKSTSRQVHRYHFVVSRHLYTTDRRSVAPWGGYTGMVEYYWEVLLRLSARLVCASLCASRRLHVRDMRFGTAVALLHVSFFLSRTPQRLNFDFLFLLLTWGRAKRAKMPRLSWHLFFQAPKWRESTWNSCLIHGALRVERSCVKRRNHIMVERCDRVGLM